MEALSEPAEEKREHVVRLLSPLLVPVQTGKARRRTKLPEPRVLLAGSGQGLAEASLRTGLFRLGLSQQQLAHNAMRIGLNPPRARPANPF